MRKLPVYALRSLTTLRALACGTLLVAALPSAHGAIFIVNNTKPSGAGSLRAALNSANANPDHDDISFAPGVSGTISPGSELVINGSVTINGPGATNLSISGANSHRVFNVLTTSPVAISGLRITGGRTSDSGAGLVHAQGMLTISNCVFFDNSSSAGGLGAGGGAIYNSGGNLVLTNCSFEANTLTSSNSYGGAVFNSGTVAATSCLFTGNTARANGGGIYTIGPGAIEVTRCSFSQGSAFEGGAIANGSGTLTVAGSTFTSNTANLGGAIMNRERNGIVHVTSSTFASNSSTAGGGAIFNNGDSDLSSGSLTVLNCTFGNNSSNFGGALQNNQGANASVDSSTFSGNTASDASGGIYNASSVAIGNSIFAGANGSVGGTNSIIDNGYNISSGNSGFFSASTNQLNTDPLLGPLQNNGGPTQTFAPQSGSPAIDRGNTTLTIDQRRISRPIDIPGVANGTGNASDVGAVELDVAQSGSTRTVNVLTDHDDGTCGVSDCTLREAIATAPAGGTVTFSPLVAGTITLGGTQLVVTRAVTITGPGARVLTIDANRQSRVFLINSGVANISGLTISGATHASGGGGIRVESSLNISDSVVSGNTANQGGGIYLSEFASLGMTRCTVSNNTATAFYGGGVANRNSNQATISITNSSFSGNSAPGGGAIANYSGFFNATTMLVSNCTFSGNTAPVEGGGIFNSTDRLRLDNNIFNDTSGGSISNSNGGTVVDNGHNIAIDNAGGTLTAPTSRTNTNPMLGPLQNNGGPTPTFALLAGSPAIDAGNTALTVDQRGFARPFGPADDIGAFEVTFDPTNANALTVTTAEDIVLADGLVSLREAIIFANSDGADSTINFDADVFNTPRVVTLQSELPAIVGNGRLTITGSAAGVAIAGNGHRIAVIESNAVVIFDSLTLSGASAANGVGGAILLRGDMLIVDSVLSGNSAAQGGAIYLDPGAKLTLERSTLRDNSTTGTFGKGGAIHNNGALRVDNSTFAGNSAGFGAALYNAQNPTGAVSLDSVSIAFNTAGDCGGIVNDSSAAVGLRNTLIAHNNTGGGTNRAQIAGNFSGSFNLISNGEGGTGLIAGMNGNQVGTPAAMIEPQLGPLAHNGGPTPTLALLAGSPAIDTGSTGIATDQRGVTRPQGAANDIGAFEVGPPVAFVSAVSRKVHGATGAFDINLPVKGLAAVECRGGGPNGTHQVVVTFAGPVGVGALSIISRDSLAGGTRIVSGPTVTINLTAVTNAQTLGIRLFDVTNGTSSMDVFIPMSVLLGDTTQNGSVTASDIGETKARSGQAVGGGNFRSDVTANGGAINASDVSLVKSTAGSQLP